ncbi:hypothetical protein JM946_07375 [Steroidobacter sp. S1-65]|uniref:SAF domain-containing protein n=1 Tax=Steroidobacter gossypii TaxID=2805490 RepID=A0ABS1WUB0_9GAMM|nr:hypothetical protein [Steroidobacter gossypii]MBM0104562.1 hypothetical protein [Steroidobacter gossypii]
MRTSLTLVVAVAISLATLSVLEWNTYRHLPAGEVTIVQIEEPTSVAPLAQAELDSQRVRTANRL